MSGFWIFIIVALIFGIIIGNILLLRDHKGFHIPKDFKKRKYDDDDEDDGSGFY